MFYDTPLFQAYMTVIAFISGTVAASFLTCMGWRMCNGESVLKGRSHCDSCGHVLHARDLIPILSYLAGKGRCRYCGASVSSLNLYEELVMGSLFALFVNISDDLYLLPLELFFLAILYLVTVTDIYEQIIPDGVLLTAILVKCLHTFAAYGFGWYGTVGSAGAPNVWIALCYLFLNGLSISLPLLLLVLVMEKIWKKDAMGGGDIKLFFVTGMYLGWLQNILVLFIACVIGIVIGMISQSRKQTPYFAFGPAIALSTVFVMIFGQAILDAYLSLF